MKCGSWDAISPLPLEAQELAHISQSILSAWKQQQNVAVSAQIQMEFHNEKRLLRNCLIFQTIKTLHVIFVHHLILNKTIMLTLTVWRTLIFTQSAGSPTSMTIESSLKLGSALHIITCIIDITSKSMDSSDKFNPTIRSYNFLGFSLLNWGVTFQGSGCLLHAMPYSESMPVNSHWF